MKKSSVLLTVGIITGFITVVMLGLGIFTAAFLDGVLVSKAAEKTAMTNSSYAQWGQVPGSIGVNVTRKYTFFNFTNPFEFFWFNQTPTFTQMPGQLYQEFQNFTNPTYDSTDPDNGAMVDFGYQLMLHELNPSPLTVTTMNIGPLGFWNTAKNLPPYQIAFYGFVTLVLGLDANIITRIQAGGLMKTCLISSDNIIQNILTPLGVTDSALQSFMVNDPVYGMGNVATLTQWVLAISQGPDSDSAYMIGNYFYLTYDQLTTLFGNTGDLATCLTEVNEIIQTKYTCASVPCDGNSLWLDQWTTQGVTNNPPNGYFTANASIASFNASIDGYAEISNFLTNYFLVNEKVNTSLYQGVVFDSDLAAQLLNVTPTPGNSHNVNTEPNTLANIANLAFIYGYGQAFDATNQTDDLTLLAPIANRFDLPSLQHAHVIWKYVQYFEQEFIVRQSKSGTTADLVAGQIFSTTLPMLFNFAQEGGTVLGVPQDLTSQILYKFIKGNNTNCQTLFTASASTVLDAAAIQKICGASLFSGWSLTSVTDLYAACMRPNGPGYGTVVGTKAITSSQLTTFCTTQGPGTYFAYASAAETYMKTAYGCAANFTTVTKCSNRELIVMQWTSSLITMNPPDLLKDKYSPSLTLYSWYPGLVLFPFEYQLAIQSLGPNFNNDPAQMQPLPYYMANALLTYDALFNQVVVQRSFIAFNTQDWDWFKNVLSGVTPYNIISYIRFTVIQSAFEGFGQTRDAKDLLWGYADVFLLITALQPVYSSGDPSINYEIALAGKNCTGKKDTLFNGTMYTGVNDSSLTRQFYSVNGLSTITYSNTYFNGSDVTTQFDSPWKQNIPLQGTDANINPPGIDKDDTVSVYLSDINYIGELSYDSTQKYSGLEAYRFKLPKSALQNSTNNPSNDKWFSDRWDGLLNLTTLQKAPLFISKGHMLDVDPSLPSKFVVYNDSTQQYKVTPNSADDIYLDIEPYSGVAVGTMVRLQANLEIKPDSLFPNPNYYMLPVFLTERGMNFTSGQVQDTFGDLKTGVKFKHIGIPVFFALFAVFLAITIFVFVKRRSVMKRIVVNDASSPYHKFVEENSGHHHQSPPGQSGDDSRVAHQDYAKEPYQQA